MGSRKDSGQSTVEFALVCASLMAILLGVAALWHAGQDGRLLGLVREHLSHSFDQAIDVGGIQDVFLY